jgi:hypothetical protein
MLTSRLTEHEDDLIDSITSLELLQRMDYDRLARKIRELFWDVAAKA